MASINNNNMAYGLSFISASFSLCLLKVKALASLAYLMPWMFVTSVVFLLLALESGKQPASAAKGSQSKLSEKLQTLNVLMMDFDHCAVKAKERSWEKNIQDSAWYKNLVAELDKTECWLIISGSNRQYTLMDWLMAWRKGNGRSVVFFEKLASALRSKEKNVWYDPWLSIGSCDNVFEKAYFLLKHVGRHCIGRANKSKNELIKAVASYLETAYPCVTNIDLHFIDDKQAIVNKAKELEQQSRLFKRVHLTVHQAELTEESVKLKLVPAL